MEAFHVVIDSSVLWHSHFLHPSFDRLLRRSEKGSLKIYLPHIVLEEHRTQWIDDMLAEIQNVDRAYRKLRAGGKYKAFLTGLRDTYIDIWSKDEIAEHSRNVFKTFLEKNKIETIHITPTHTANAWTRYFDTAPPFTADMEREDRRKDIPDSWILEAALEIKAKPGRRCALVKDGRLKKALAAEGFEIFADVDSLDAEIEKATAVDTGKGKAPETGGTTLEQLYNDSFKKVREIVLGVNEALESPGKEKLFSELERAGMDRKLVEHEAYSLVLMGVLNDTGNHLVPVNRALAQQAASTDATTAILLKLI